MRARLVAVLVALAAAPAARAQGYYPPRYPPPPRETGIYLGGKLGIGFPNGDLSGDVGAMGDTVTSKVPLGFEFGARLNRVVRLGIFGDLGFGGVKDLACGQSSCSSLDTRFGADVQFHFGTHTPADPWFGLGLAYEWLSNSGVLLNTGEVVDETWSGGEFVLEGGVDIPLARQFTIGPFLGLEFGRFSHYSATGAPSFSIGSTAGHGWITIGLKGTFLL
jgi:opacity protein-like surface antigen